MEQRSRTKRWAAALLAACALAAGSGFAAIGASAPPQAEAVINPTSRILEMSVPLHYGKYYLGDLEVRITPQQKVEVLPAAIVAGVKPILREAALIALKAAAESGGSHADLAELRAKGFDFRFDPEAVSVQFSPTLDQKAEGNISVHTRAEQIASPNAAEPADFAAFLNLRSAVDYITESPGGDEGLRAPRFDLEAAARWQGFVLEAEGTFEPDEVSIFGEQGGGFKRRGTRLVRDFEDAAVRASAGDVEPVGSSFQYTPDLLGFSLERSYGKLQPGRNIRSTSRRSFRIERPSNVDVEVNGIVARRLKLDPGDYNIADLPIALGVNDIALVIVDDAGNKERLEFSVFLDSDLMAPGFSEWAFAAGVPTEFDSGEPDYGSDDLFVTGYYRRGLSESVTGEAHLQGNSDAVMGGLGMLLGTPVGLFSLEGAASAETGGRWGAAFDGQYALAKIEDWSGRQHSVRLAAKASTPDFAVPDGRDLDGKTFGYDHWLALSANYGTRLPFNVAASVSAGYAFGEQREWDSYNADLSLSRPFGRTLSMGVSAGYQFHEEEADDLSLLFRLQYRPDDRSTLSATHDARHGRSAVAGRRDFGEGIGGWQTSVTLSHDMPGTDHSGYEADDELLLDASAHYTGNRANISLSQESGFVGLDGAMVDQRTSLRMESAIAFADGHVAVGRPVTNGFAIVTPHAGLAGNVIGVGKGRGGYTAQTDLFGPALLPSVSPYTLNRLDYDVADLPPGYDLGDGVFDLMPRHKSGYALKVGSDYTVTALGILETAAGAPVALLTGVASEKSGSGRTVEVFTNRQGRFSAQGLAPGDWLIEMATEPKTQFLLRVPADAVGWYKAETLRPLAGGAAE